MQGRGVTEMRNIRMTPRCRVELINLEPESSSGIIRAFIRLTASTHVNKYRAVMLTKYLPEPEVGI